MSTVVVGWIDGGMVTGPFSFSLARMVAYSTASGLLSGVNRWQSGPTVEVGRNGLVTDFLESDAEWLLQIDSDMVFEHDALEKLLGTAERMHTPVVAGLCFGYKEPYGPYPTVGMFNPDPEGEHSAVKWSIDVPATDRAGCVRCDVTGAAMLLTHRSVFELDSMVDKPFRRIELGGVLTGEDVSFCHRLFEAGIPVIVDTNVETGHVKQFVWDRESHARYKKDEAAADGR